MSSRRSIPAVPTTVRDLQLRNFLSAVRQAINEGLSSVASSVSQNVIIKAPGSGSGATTAATTSMPKATSIERVWMTKNAGEPIYSTPIFVPNFTCATFSGPVFIYQSWDWYLYVVRASNGSTVWRYPFGAENYGRPQYVNHAGVQRIFGASHDGYVYCLDENGNKLWHVANLYIREGAGTLTYNGSGAFTDATKSWAANSFLRSLSHGNENAKLNITVSGVPHVLDIKTCQGTSISVYSPPPGLVVGNSYSYTITPRYESDVYFQHAGKVSIEAGVLYLYVCGFDGQCIKIDVATGNVVWKFSTLENIEPFPLVSDIDNNGSVEVVVSSVDWQIYILNGATGQQISAISGGEGFDSFVFAETIKGDGVKYIVSGCRDGRVYTINGATKLVDNVSTEFGTLAGNDIDAGCALIPNIDGTFDILMVGDPGFIVKFDKELNVKWRRLTGLLHNSTPQVVTIGVTQVIVACDMSGGVSFYSVDGELLSQFHVRGGIEGTPYIGDIDNDGLVEMLITTIDGYVYLIKIFGV